MSECAPSCDQVPGAVVQNAAYKGYADGSVEFFGDQIEILTGYSRHDFNSRRLRWLDIMHSDDRDAAKKAFMSGLKGDKTYTRQYRVVTKSGQTLWIQGWGQIVCDAEGKIDSVIGVILDITAQKLAEEQRLRIQQRTGKYLLFSLNAIQYGIPIERIQEIVRLLPMTPVPGTPAHVRGMMNLRGKVIPVVDLRRRFMLPEAECSQETCIIVVEVLGTTAPMLFGLLVDAVSEVQHIRGEDIDEPPQFGMNVDVRWILGMAPVKKTLTTLLDIDQVLRIEGLEALNKETISNEKS
ncbi:MAG: chemotaxis protein CheW [Desulfosoma sp.]|uniref:chemotaxis protein CheW n=1 Tax=Desulfosoma sp. TaxID=2603217 RepID=UPI00404A7D83